MNSRWNSPCFCFAFISGARTRLAGIVFVLLLAAGMHASTVEHPGVLHENDVCSSCHADKISGMSVHSALAISCTVCHLAQTQGDMTTLSLIMPKEQICFACHERSAGLQQHSPAVKGLCVDCHDAHRSDRRMLLRPKSDALGPRRPAGALPR